MWSCFFLTTIFTEGIVRLSANHGGVLIAIRGLAHKRILLETKFDCVLVQVYNSSDSILICCVYTPPKQSPFRMPTQDFKNFLETLDKIKTAQNCSSIIIFSDINLQETTWEVLASEDEYESALLEKLEDMSFYQALPNRNGRNLDIFLTQLPETVEHSCIDSEIETSFSTSEKKCSDHYSFRTVFSFEFKRTRSSPKKMLAFKKANWEQMNMYISEHPFIPYCFSNIVELVKQWYIWLQKVIFEKVPRVTAHRSGSAHPHHI